MKKAATAAAASQRGARSSCRVIESRKLPLTRRVTSCQSPESYQLPVTSYESVLFSSGYWELETGKWELGAGNWKLGTRSWKLETDTAPHAGLSWQSPMQRRRFLCSLAA